MMTAPSDLMLQAGDRKPFLFELRVALYVAWYLLCNSTTHAISFRVTTERLR
jgi:hypothetical protein